MNILFYKLIIKRIFHSIIILFLLITVVFFLIRIAPGDHSQKFISPNFNKELSEQIKNNYGLNKSLSEQYLLFIKNMFTGNFGISYEYRESVINVLKRFLPFSVIFALLAISLQLIISIQLARISILNKNKFIDKIISQTMILFFAVPTFVWGLFLVFIFSVKLNLLPSSGLQTIGGESKNIFFVLTENAKHLILPLLTISIPGAAVFYRYIRDNIESIYESQFIISLRANGVCEKNIIKKHLIPNSIIPVISTAGIEMGILFGGALITEVIFSLPGMGRLTVQSILMRDYPMVIGVVLCVGALIIITNFIAEVVSIIIDKRNIKVLQ